MANSVHHVHSKTLSLGRTIGQPDFPCRNVGNGWMGKLLW